MEENTKDLFGSIPEGFVAEALALTSPRDAGVLSLVNSVFWSAAKWDSVWETFIPPEYLMDAEAVVGRNISKKDVYLHLCDHHVIIKQGKMSFSLSKWSGKNCYMLAVKELSIHLGDSPTCWKWTSIAESRFSEVAELMSVCLLQVSGKINTSILSRKTTYVAHLVFKTTSNAYGFEYQPMEVRIGIHGDKFKARMVYLDPQAGQRRRLKPRTCNGRFWRGAITRYDPPSDDNVPKHRKDGWFEVEIGEYYNEGSGDDTELEMTVMEVEGGGNRKAGLIIQGIEIRANI